MLAKFFIDRPVLAWVISIVIVLLGGIAAALLPIAEYPEIAPPVVRVSGVYPGANAQVVSDTVAGPIEQQVIGVENMLYMSSQCNSDGSYVLDVTFDLGTDVNEAQVLLQNRVATAAPQLPAEVTALGVTVKKRSPDILLVVNLVSEVDAATEQPLFDQLYLSNYATINVRDVLAKVEGVGDTALFGQMDYSMRIWLDPGKIAALGLTAGDVVDSLREQNVQVAAGQIGAPPVPPGQDFQLTLSTLGRLSEPEEFEGIILRTGLQGEVTYLRDVARVELGSKSEASVSRLNGKPSAGIAIFQLPGSNALETADRIKAAMRELSKRFPQGLKHAIVYDTTPFISESVHEVFKTLRDAIILVAIVVLLFLQDWRSLMLPLIDVAVSLIGTLAVLLLMGFSLNNLTLFGLVLAIGIVVDDAIVVLENIERWLEKGHSVRDATIGAMGEITGPILAITLVLASVFLPSAFLGGISGQFFRQFALTISVSMIISAINAMTMTPARASSVFGSRVPGGHGAKEALPWWSFALLGGALAVWLCGPWVKGMLGIATSDDAAFDAGVGNTIRGYAVWAALFLIGAVALGSIGRVAIRPVNALLARLFGLFNQLFDCITKSYGRWVGRFLRFGFFTLLVYGGLVWLTGYGFTKVPGGFVPSQDRGYLIVNISLPDAASAERTLNVVKAAEKIAAETPGVSDVIAITGQSVVLNAFSSNYASMFIILKPFHERRSPQLASPSVAAVLQGQFQQQILDARINVFGPPAVSGLGNAGGFKLMLQATGGVDPLELQKEADQLARAANQQPGLLGVFNGFRASTPQLFIDIDRVKARSMNVPLRDVYQALQLYLGGYYTNDFNRFGRTWQVNLQADAAFRVDAQALQQLQVRNRLGEMVPLGTLLQVQDTVGPSQIVRYNTYPAATINGGFDPAIGSGAALELMESLTGNLPKTMTTDWTELSFLQRRSSRVESLKDLQQNPISAFVLGVILVFLVLAGLYESWSLPLAVILIVPMCLLSALLGVYLIHAEISIFVQVGLVVLVGLAAKNAILIVEFARDLQITKGLSAYDAAIEASTERLRPIVMTSFAFILGVFPLVISHGAGAEMRRPLGTTVFAGMLGVTFFGLFLTPVFYYLLRRGTPVPPQGETAPRTTDGPAQISRANSEG